MQLKRFPGVCGVLILLVFTTCKKGTPAPVPEPSPTGPVLPTVSTSAITNIGFYTATGGGNVSSEGNSAITSVGLCWDTLPNPTTLRYNHAVGAGTGTFVLMIDSLKPAKKYFVRAYARNYGGTAYGNQVEFTTSFKPPVADLFTERNFKIIAATIVPMLSGISDLYANWDPCSKDDIYRFEKSGILSLDQGLLKCFATDPQTTNGNWVLSNSDKQFTMVINGNTQVYDIVKNDGNEFVIKYSSTFSGNMHTITYTFKEV